MIHYWTVFDIMMSVFVTQSRYILAHFMMLWQYKVVFSLIDLLNFFKENQEIFLSMLFYTGASLKSYSTYCE
jgi:hypothetical protein